MAKRWVEVATLDGESQEPVSVMLDIEFLMSGYSCAWGSGCKGIYGDPNHGCCQIGVLVDEDERSAMEHYVSLLAPGNWENHGQPWLERWPHGGWRNKLSMNPEMNTTLRPDGKACIFSNSADFAGGAGCALHLAAMARGESYIGTKPYACWSIPIRLSYDEDHNAYWLRGTAMSEWGDELDWYCMDPNAEDVGAIAWAESEPVYQRYDDVITAMVEMEGFGLTSYLSDVKPVLDHLWERAPKVNSGAVPVTLTSRSDHG